MGIRSWGDPFAESDTGYHDDRSGETNTSLASILLAGANDYIVKPFNLDEVAARVTVQLRNQPTVAQEAQASQKRSL